MRAVAAVALVTLSVSPMLCWTAVFHAVADNHHRRASTGRGDAVRLDLALHGHGHDDGTPPHRHPLLVSGTTPLPGRALVLAGAMNGGAPEVPRLAPPRLRLLSPPGSAHDPPPRFATPSVLRV